MTARLHDCFCGVLLYLFQIPIQKGETTPVKKYRNCCPKAIFFPIFNLNTADSGLLVFNCTFLRDVFVSSSLLLIRQWDPSC